MKKGMLVILLLAVAAVTAEVLTAGTKLMNISSDVAYYAGMFGIAVWVLIACFILRWIGGKLTKKEEPHEAAASTPPKTGKVTSTFSETDNNTNGNPSAGVPGRMHNPDRARHGWN
jgi:hypothetical protein